MRRFVFGDAGEDFDFGAFEEAADERRERSRAHRERDILLGLEAVQAGLDEVAPAALGGAPAFGEFGVADSCGPEFPEYAYVAGADVFAQVVAGRSPLVGEGALVGEQGVLAFEQAVGEVFEHGHQQPALGAEVVVDEREPGAARWRRRASRWRRKRAQRPPQTGYRIEDHAGDALAVSTSRRRARRADRGFPGADAAL